MTLRCLLAGLLCCLLTAARAQEAPLPVRQGLLQGCAVGTPAEMPDWADLPARDPEDERLEVFSGRVAADLAAGTVATERIRIRHGEGVLNAPGARFDDATGLFSLEGGLEYRDPQSAIVGRDASFDVRAESLLIEGSEFELFGVPSRGSAGSIAVGRTSDLVLKDVAYTTCARGDEDWVLRAESITIDREDGVATARNARLAFMGVPILYTPWISYPVTNQRKSGFLLPGIGRSETRGFEVQVPYYLNLAPNYDATFTPRYMDRRGLELTTEFRYLWPGHAGTVDLEYLPNDKGTDEDRYLFGMNHQSLLGAGWRATLDGRAVSDTRYFEDLYGGVSATSQTHLERVIDFEYFGDFVSVLARFQGFETLDESLVGEDKPYRRVPQLATRAYLPGGPLGLDWRMDGELSVFDRGTGVTGGRLHLMPGVAAPLAWRGLRLEPAAALAYTAYSLDDDTPGADERPDVAVPVLSVDLGSVFERGARGGSGWLQTLEPRVQYVYIPFRNQDDQPVFDTIEPDFNVVQLFRPNRFLGYDRLGDTNEINVGLTTRVIDAADGKQVVTASVGQSRYLTDGDVTLPGVAPEEDDSSDWLAEMGVDLWDHWKLDVGYQWDADVGQSQRLRGRLQYRLDGRRVANLGYRYRRDVLEDIELSAAWPVTDHWSAVARYDYSIFDSEPRERFVGFEYQTCCWGLRVVYRRYLASRDGESDTAIALQLVLKGLTNVGDPADRLLERGILGYDLD